MGNAEMKNLENENILTDYGEVSIDIINELENKHKIILPNRYTEFIIKHDGASLNIDHFEYNDPNYDDGKGSNSIAFLNIVYIQKCIDNIQSGEEPDWDIKYRFEDGLIPFGDNGGGDKICFDYRCNRNTDNPPIVIWNHDMGLEHRVVFIANNFEEFINMLHESAKNE
jgi:cell wall assembly regulator SMI1